MDEFEQELSALINKYSIEKHSNTPDWILAKYLINCLDTFASANKARDRYFLAQQ